MSQWRVPNEPVNGNESENTPSYDVTAVASVKLWPHKTHVWEFGVPVQTARSSG